MVALVSAGPAQAVTFDLTILHNNDGESDIFGSQSNPDFGGAAEFTTLVKGIQSSGGNVLTLSSGDNFLPGPEFDASLADGIFYDALLLNEIGYDAIAIGNHEFDSGPGILGDLIQAYNDAGGTAPFLSANLDFSSEPALSGLAADGKIASSTIVEKGGQQIGIVGATTPNLSFISSPGAVGVQDPAAPVQAEIDALTAAGVDNIIFISHLQGVDEDRELIAKLEGIDVAIAGGGDELLANPGDELIPGDTAADSYPIFSEDKTGKAIPIVTTAGGYNYLGRLDVTFEDGDVITVNGGPIRVAGGSQPDAVAPDPTVQSNVVEPVQAFVDSLDQTIVGTSEVEIQGGRDIFRAREANVGNLLADAILTSAQQLSSNFGIENVDIALTNGGGIRNEDPIPAGDISRADTKSIAQFSNFVTVIEDVKAGKLKEILENAVSRIELDADGNPVRSGEGTGRFAQIAGFSFEYNPTLTAAQVEGEGLNVTTVVDGERIQTIILNDGTVLVEAGRVVTDATVDIATVDFLARGGDQYPFNRSDFTSLGVTYEQALADYISNELNGLISAGDPRYQPDGEGRITLTDAVPSQDPASVPEPGTVLGLMALAGLGAGTLRRRQTA
ncbi:5'-nucleotidase C-terminal domain-containing protein [Halomicronema hongdechloris]|nr:5'-nucleotidase C-terminal domain-containing protein [Halomicronema hongdechloris]